MKKIFLSLIFIIFSLQLFSIDFSKLNTNQINDIKKAVDILTISALEDETIELSFTLSIIPFFKENTFERYIEKLEKYRTINDEKHPLYHYISKINYAYKAGQTYLKNLSEKQKKSQIKELELAYGFLDMLGLKNVTKKEILKLLKEASNNRSRGTDRTESNHNFFIKNDVSNELINALKILEIDTSRLKQLIPATLVDDYYNTREYEYEEVGKYSDQDFEKIQKAYSFLKSKVFHVTDPKK